MNLFNIRGINIIDEIEKSIYNVKKELYGLITEQTCKIYNSHLLIELRNHHLQVRLINTLDFGFDYEHYFLLISSLNEYYLADLTYAQFNSEEFKELKEKGYTKINNQTLNEYLSIVSKEEVNNFTCDTLFYMEIVNKKL